MDELLYDSLGELLALAGTALLSGGLTVAGLLTERAALRDLTAGQVTLGVWELAAGGLVLYVGLYLLGYHKVWQPIRGREAS